ncbi:YciI family protein [candidate division KSB1 bacterium]|nr:YciI family protein [candidate division KSB1 bacterium]
MQFLFLLTQIEEAWTKAPPGEGERVYQQYMALEREMKEQGKLVASVRLRPRSEAKTLRNLANGKRQLVNGPFADTEEALGGYYILECASMDEALAWAERMPNYGHGSIEIRPFWE